MLIFKLIYHPDETNQIAYFRNFRNQTAY